MLLTDSVGVTGVKIGPVSDSVTIFAGKTLALYPVISPANASNQSVTWSSGNTAAATVDANGVVTGVAAGSAVITVTTADGSRTASTTVQVAAPIPVTGVSVSAHEQQSDVGTVDNPKILSLGSAIQLYTATTPANATEQAVTWSVSDPAVLSVTSYGKAAAVGAGSAYVTAATVDGNYTASFYIRVPDESFPVRGVSLSASAATIYLGEDGLELTATVFPTNATNPALEWSSSDPSVATVDQEGRVTPVAAGYATINARAQENPGISAACAVSVQPQRVRVESIRFAADAMELGLYGVATLAPIIAPENATDKSVTWETSNKYVATVSRTGVVTALNIGTATITATTADGGIAATVTVRVSSGAALGDVNNDGEVDAGDAILILRYIVGLYALSAAQQAVADVNSDGEIDVGDAILILRYDAGLITAFPKAGN